MSDYLCTGGHRQDNNCDCRGNDRDDCRDDRREHRDCRKNDRDDRRDDCRMSDRDDDCRKKDRDDCACRRGLVQALQMLLRSGLSSLVDFQTFAFVTEDFLVGDTFVAATPTGEAYDNLGPELAGSFNRFSPCACDFIDVTGAVFLPTAVAGDAVTGLTASRLNLCDITAIAFEVEEDTAEPPTDNYQSARRLLQRLLQGPCRSDSPPYPDPCDEMCQCRCDEDDFLGGSVSLVAAGLLLANMTVLGKVGKVQVLANDTDERFYFVCTDKATVIQ